MATATRPCGPRVVRQQLIPIENIDSESAETGWRGPNKERLETLKNIFLRGSYGLGVFSGVQTLEKESALGQKVVDDGVSTVAALKECAAIYADNSELTPDGEV